MGKMIRRNSKEICPLKGIFKGRLSEKTETRTDTWGTVAGRKIK